jgi:hypothetical protein
MIKSKLPPYSIFVRPLVRKGSRLFAVAKRASLTDRIARVTTQGMRTGSERHGVGRVLTNQQHSYDTCNSRWANRMRKVRFAGRS